MDKIIFNVSERYNGKEFFDLLGNNEHTFRMLRGAVLNNTISGITGIMQPKQTCSVYEAIKSGKSRFEIAQRRGYKAVIFYEY